MKKLLSVLLIMLLFVGVLAACAEAPDPEDENTTHFVPTINVLNYAVFLSLLERNGLYLCQGLSEINLLNALILDKY